MNTPPAPTGQRGGSSTGVPAPLGVWLLCRARTRLCALPVERIVETMRPLPAAPFPGAPPFVLGLARIRGAAVPVLDLGGLLGCAEPSQVARFLTLRLDDRRVALAVESVLGLRALSHDLLSELPPLLANAQQDAVVAIGTLDAELLLTLDATRVVPDRLWPLLDAGGPP